MSTITKQPTVETRSLRATDLERVVAIDASLTGRSRRTYFERRLEAARRDPAPFFQLGAERGGALAGFMIGRLLEGEFGRSAPAARLEALGVLSGEQHRGIGAALASAFEREAAARGAAEIRTSAAWRDHALLAFLDHAGYRLAESHVLGRRPGDLSPEDRDAVETQVLQEPDIEGIARIDARLTGRERRGYLCRALRDSLGDSAIRVSLVARIDGAVAGFVMARMDYGDFGRAEPAAMIDTLGVDPLRSRQGIGRALLSQLLLNLGALGVEQVETIVAPGQLDLLGFFYAAGFTPSERLAFVKRLP